MKKIHITRLTQDQLASLTPTDYELISEQGADFRQMLSDRVLSFLIIPQGWNARIEYGSEFGGTYPVTIEYLPETDREGERAIYVSSCGEENPQWGVVTFDREGQAEWRYNADKFEPEGINSIIRNIAAQWALRQ